MAIKTFTTGEVLTASDTNTYLANAGLVFIANATPNGAVTTDITNCFTSTYDFYVLEAAFYGSTAVDFLTRYLTGTNTPDTTNNYYRYGFYYAAGTTNFTAGPMTSQFFGNTNATVGVTSITRMTIHNPFSGAIRTVSEHFHFDAQSGLIAQFASQHATTTSFTGIRFYPSNGTTTLTGRINVYGMRQS